MTVKGNNSPCGTNLVFTSKPRNKSQRNHEAVKCDPTTYGKYETASEREVAARLEAWSNEGGRTTGLLQFSGMSVAGSKHITHFPTQFFSQIVKEQ